MKFIKKLISDLLLAFGFSIRGTPALTRMEELARSRDLLGLLAASPLTKSLSLEKSFEIIAKSRSQLGQDILAISQVGVEKRGFFVEFGATNGLDLSNSFLLEKDYGWQGILCEPAKEWHEKLMLNRSCAIDTRCVYSSTGERIEFSEASVGELSTISSFRNSDGNRAQRRFSSTYEVETVTLLDLLLTHEAPSHIDFLSIDTEGSEFEILKAFDFSQYSFGLICVEHNFTENREKISKLLIKNGYSQVFRELSAWDDWYVGSRR
jgi:FkbM family methyltransferase